jgi:hypothetical protein
MKAVRRCVESRMHVQQHLQGLGVDWSSVLNSAAEIAKCEWTTCACENLSDDVRIRNGGRVAPSRKSIGAWPNPREALGEHQRVVGTLVD